MSRGFYGVALDSPKTNSNVGCALRAAHCFGADFFLVENHRYTGSIVDTTKGERHIPFFHGKILDMVPENTELISIEITDDAESLIDFIHPERALYVFGREDGSISQEILDKSMTVVKIPTSYCLNLAGAVNVALYDREAKKDKLQFKIDWGKIPQVPFPSIPNPWGEPYIPWAPPVSPYPAPGPWYDPLVYGYPETPDREPKYEF